jgi:squalene monooxygenase
MFETEATATIKGEHSDAVLGVETRTKNPETGKKEPDCFFGQLTIIADGYASIFRKSLLNKAPLVRSKFYALELIDCPFPPANYGHVVIGPSSLCLLYQIGTHETRALIDVPEKHPDATPANGGVRGYIEKVVLPSLPPQVQPSVRTALSDGKIPRSMPNSWLPPTKQTTHAGVVVLGDAHNMRHPLTGGGMTVAFNDAVLLASLLHPGHVPDLADHAAVRRAMAAFHWRRKSLTSIINVLAQALYDLFAADDWQLRALQRGCFRYFQMGKTDEPVALMGGIMHRPLVLASHFFTVAFVAIWMNIVEVCGGSVLGILKLPLALVQAVLILWKACVVFLPVFWTELM